MRAALHRPQRNWGARLREYDVAGGLRAVFLENEFLRVGVLADRGTDVFELLYKPRDLDFAWLAAGGVRDARTFTLGSSEPFLDVYPGGWQEVLPNGGGGGAAGRARRPRPPPPPAPPPARPPTPPAPPAGPAAPRFGAPARRTPPARVKDLRPAAGEPRLRISETLINESDVSARLMWGHHIAFGPPFLEPGCRVELPDAVEAIAHAEPLND